VIDADTQVIEPGAIWSEYLEPEYRVLARSAFWHDAGEVSPFTVVNGKQVRETTASRIPREAIWRPGMALDDIGDLDPMAPHEINPGAQEPKARLRDMDAMGVTAAVLFPYYFGEYFPLVENPDVAAALARAYNNWIFDFARTESRRLVPAAVLPIQNINFALAELRRIEKMGFRTVVMRPVFVCDRYLNHPYYDALWAEIAKLGVTAAIRAAAGSSNPEWSAHGPFIERVSAGFGIGHPAASTIAPMMDNMSALLVLLAHAHLTRFEGLKLVLTNSKASWLPLVLEKSEGYLTIAAAASIPVRVDSDKVFFEQGSSSTPTNWACSACMTPSRTPRSGARTIRLRTQHRPPWRWNN
jgi:predicted TIM-barrel fold metal-dependent hydrolase